MPLQRPIESPEVSQLPALLSFTKNKKTAFLPNKTISAV
jgi:hypothetical protein